MKPKGLVAALSITSQISMPILWHSSLSSFTSAIFTQRKIFSSSLVISAARVELTGTTRATICAYRLAAAFPLAPFTPPTTFGICARPKCLLPGSSRFQNGQHQFLGGSRIGGAFQHDELLALQMRSNGARGILHVGEIRLAALVERSRHANQRRVHLADLRKIRGGAKMLAADVLGNFRSRNVLDVRCAAVEFLNFFRIRVEAGDAVPFARKAQRQRQADVSAADDSNAQTGARKKLRRSRHFRNCSLKRRKTYIIQKTVAKTEARGARRRANGASTPEINERCADDCKYGAVEESRGRRNCGPERAHDDAGGKIA